jgi:hypothetical protein
MSDDANKKLVLARRARFVAAALAGISVACCGKDKASPFVCLDVPAPEDASVTTPQVCLTATDPAGLPDRDGHAAVDTAAGCICVLRADAMPRRRAAALSEEEGRRSVNDDAKKKILARRARFIAAAVAGISISCGKDRPEPCLSVTHVPDPDAASTPQPCLEVTASDDGGAPQPCLSPPPQPCLSVYNPPPDAGPPPRPCLKPMTPPSDAGKKTTE